MTKKKLNCNGYKTVCYLNKDLTVIVFLIAIKAFVVSFVYHFLVIYSTTRSRGGVSGVFLQIAKSLKACFLKQNKIQFSTNVLHIINRHFVIYFSVCLHFLLDNKE